MVEHFKISFEIIFGSFAKDVFYEFDIVFTMDSISKNGYIEGGNFVVIKGLVIDPENLLKKYHCQEEKWNEEFYQYLIKDNSKAAIEYFKEQKKV